MPNEIDRRTWRHRAIDDPAADPSGRKKRTTLVVLNKSQCRNPQPMRTIIKWL